MLLSDSRSTEASPPEPRAEGIALLEVVPAYMMPNGRIGDHPHEARWAAVRTAPRCRAGGGRRWWFYSHRPV
jgi:hypothetical protein